MFKIKFPKKIIRILVTAIIPVLIILASYFRIFETFELATLDLRFKIRPPQKLTDKIVIIEIAEDTINQLGEWPINRAFYATLLDTLKKYGTSAVIFDILFSQPSPSDLLLIESVKDNGKVFTPSALRLSGKESKRGFPEAVGYESEPMQKLKEVSRGVGHINAITDIDGKRRRIPLFLDLNGKLIPQISFLALCDYLGVDIKDVKVEKAKYIEIRPDIRIPIDAKGQTMVNFAGRWGQAFWHYSFIDILKSHVAIEQGKRAELDLNELRGKICLIGLTAVATHDLNPIPLQERYPMVGLHANLINTILTKAFIVRVGHLINLLILAFLSLLTVLAVFRLKPLWSILSAVGIFFGFIISAFLLFGFLNIWVDLFYPLLLISAVYIFCTFYQYITERHKRLLMERELDIAQKIQRSFLKETPPQKEGLDIAVIMNAAKSVGGDLYDFVEFKDGSMGVMIGDVSGKGIPAALFMAMTVSDFRFHAKTETDPLKVVTELNDQIAVESTSGLFVTLTYVMVDPTLRKLSIVDAGHLPVVHASRDADTSLITATGGMALGIMDGVEFNKQEVPAKPGDVFVQYTDGVTEARNIKKEELGEDRLKELVTKHKEKSAKEITEEIYKEILTFRGKAPQHDDITILTLKIK